MLIRGTFERPLTVVFERPTQKTYLKVVELEDGDYHCAVSNVSHQAMEMGVQKGDVLLRINGIDVVGDQNGVSESKIWTPQQEMRAFPLQKVFVC